MKRSLKSKIPEMQEAGFTLIEVLAALLIFSIAIIGLSQAGAQSARAVSALDSKMLAGIVADNQLVLARGREIETGLIEGETNQLSRRFKYTTQTRTSDIPQLFQITVKVIDPNTTQVLEQRIGFKSQPLDRDDTQPNPDFVDNDTPVQEGF
ncbi:MAG: type II secretion system minor pseudopilin GspI [Litorimonas sp.]